MAKFSGKIGFEIQNEDGSDTGIWGPTITERQYYGDIMSNVYKWSDGSKVNEDLNVSNKFSVVADNFAIKNLGRMLYVTWEGEKWRIITAEVIKPRIILYIGGLYNNAQTKT